MRIFYLISIFLSGVFTPLLGQDPCVQLNYHAFKAENVTGTYTDLGSLGTVIDVSEHDDGLSEPQDIGFTFEYMCQDFTQFIFSTNGFIKLGSEPLSNSDLFFSNSQSNSRGVFNSDTIADINLIVAFNHDLDQGTNGHEFRMYTSGNAPNRICTIQWKDQREWTYEPAKQFDNIDFQIKLYETTNVIELVYGEWEPSTNSSNYKTAAVGLKGLSNEDDQLLVVVKNSSAFWDNVTFVNRNYAPNESFNFGRPPERPAPDPGRTFRFTPTLFNDLTVRETYALTEASTHYSSPQWISASIRNSGYNTQTNIPVTLEVTGDNPYTKTQHISSLAFGESRVIYFYTYSPEINGTSTVRVRVGPDDANADNAKDKIQQASDYNLNYSTTEVPDGNKGFLAGVQGIYYVKYNVRGTAEVSHVDVYIADDSASIGKTVFAAVLDRFGILAARSDNYVIQEANLNSWLSFGFAVPAVIKNNEFYAGFGMTSSLQDYAPLGMQSEEPVQKFIYYKSLISGNGLVEIDPVENHYRFMIGVTLESTEPVSGIAYGDGTYCVDDSVSLSVDDYVGFIQWQQSPDGISEWENINPDSIAHAPHYPFRVRESFYYRAEITQPGFAPVYTNVVFVEVTPENPVVTQSGDVLISSVENGNQWFDENGIIEGATDQYYFVLQPGEYYVYVIEEECYSYPSNVVEVLSVATNEAEKGLSIKIYPNPVKDELYIEVEDNKELKNIEIMTMTGEKIYRGSFIERGIIQTASLIPGMYCIKMTMNEEVFIRSFIKL